MERAEINLFYAKNWQIETERLILRPITLADAEDMYVYASDEETVEFVFPQHESLIDTCKTIANYFMNEPLGKYGVEEKNSNKLIGTIDFRIHEKNLLGELGYVLNKSYWGQGFMPEAAQIFVQKGFEELGLVRIFAEHDLQNPKSGRVMEKIGMKQEGIFRNHRIWKGKTVDDAIWAITVEDYKELKELRENY